MGRDDVALVAHGSDGEFGVGEGHHRWWQVRALMPKPPGDFESHLTRLLSRWPFR